MTLLSRDDILAVDDRRYEDVPVPEWGGTVRVRSLTGAERDEFEGNSVEHSRNGRQEVNTRNIRARLVALTVVGDDGRPLFAQGDVIKLGSKNAAAVGRVFDAAGKLSGISDDDVEDLAKNSEAGQSDSSDSA